MTFVYQAPQLEEREEEVPPSKHLLKTYTKWEFMEDKLRFRSYVPAPDTNHVC